MPVRIEALNQLKQQASRGGIVLERSGGKKARARLIKAESQYNKAREKVISHEYGTGYRFWVSGGSRYDSTSHESEFIEKLTHAVVEHIGVDVITGAGPGIMGAAVAGLERAKENGNAKRSRNLGIGLQVPWEEDRKSFDYYRDHPELLTRVQELIDLSHATYIGPGAIGTNLELWAIIQLKQMGHIEPEYAIVAHPSWEKNIEEFRKQWFEERVAHGVRPTMNKDDLNITFSDDIEEIVGIIAKSHSAWKESVGNHVYQRSRIIPWRRRKLNQ